MVFEIIPWQNLYGRYEAGPGYELATPGFQIQSAAYCATKQGYICVKTSMNEPEVLFNNSLITQDLVNRQFWP